MDYLGMQANIKPFNGDFVSSDPRTSESNANEIMMAAASTDEYGGEIQVNKKV